MLRTTACLLAALFVAGSLHTASAQTTTPAPAVSSVPAVAKPSRMKLTAEKLRDMKAKDWPATTAGSISGSAWRRPEAYRWPVPTEKGHDSGGCVPLKCLSRLRNRTWHLACQALGSFEIITESCGRNERFDES